MIDEQALSAAFHTLMHESDESDWLGRNDLKRAIEAYFAALEPGPVEVSEEEAITAFFAQCHQLHPLDSFTVLDGFKSLRAAGYRIVKSTKAPEEKA